MSNTNKYIKITQLLKDILHTKNWTVSIRRKFWKIVPWNTTSIVLLTIVSQLFFMVAFLLPIKIIMMLGSGGIPRYVPQSLTVYGYETLVVGLSVLVFVFYLFYILCEKEINHLVDKGTTKLLAHTNKSSLFENQEQVAFNAYMKYSRAIAGVIFGLLVMGGLAFVYQKLFFFLVIYFLLCIGIVGMLVATSQNFYDYLVQKSPMVLSTISNLGFFAVFLFMVYDILFAGAKLNFLIIIVSVILSRQLLSQLTGAIQNIKAIYNQRMKINALFYHGHTLNTTVQMDKNHFWSMLEDERSLKALISQVLVEVLEKRDISYSYSWYGLNVANMAVFKIDVKDEKSSYLIQIFNTNQSSVAKHQLDFLEKADRKLFLEFLGVSVVEQCHCHLFKFDDKKQFEPKRFKQAHFDFFVQLMRISPCEELVNMYKKSKPLLHKRIHQYMVDRVSLAIVNQEQKEAVEYFKQNFNRVISLVDKMPLHYINPIMWANLLKGEENISAAFWGRWSFEPVGVYFPIGRLKELEKSFDSIKSQREDLSNLSIVHIALVANLSEFERLSSKMNYTQALDRLEEVVMCFKKIDLDV